MCGIAGYQLTHGTHGSADRVIAMLRRIAHRGPDDEGVALIDPASHHALGLRTRASPAALSLPDAEDTRQRHAIAMGHRRFAIVDLSIGGHQPFISPDRRICVTFNGEIYNYVELRDELARLGHRFASTSDTEVLAAAYAEWHTECFAKFVGFFAIALWDRDRGQLLLARDRLGKAPLYVAHTPDGLVWCSEIKGILEHSGTGTIGVRASAVADFVAHGWRDVDDGTLYEGITTFARGTYAWVLPNGSLQSKTYWRLPSARMRESDLSIEDASDHLRALLADAIGVRLRADVPVAFELSGGLDSSSLCAVAAAGGHGFSAYNVAFPGTDADEEPFARRVAQRYPEQMDYRVLHASYDDLLDNCDDYVALMGEPFHSPNMRTNQATWRRLGGDGIKVSINGAGGDELLGGYGDYLVPHLSGLLRAGHPVRALREASRYTTSPARPLSPRWGFRMACALGHAAMMQFPAAAAAFENHRNRRPAELPGFRGAMPVSSRAHCEVEQLLHNNMGSWLMNYWLRSGHQSFMGVPVEVRMPFLDHRVVEFAFQLPAGYLIRDGWSKWLLRRAMASLLPGEVTWRRVKMGFPFPYAAWFRRHRSRLIAAIRESGCPFVDPAAIERHYAALAETRPLYLWRLFSVALWFRRCVLDQPLAPAAPRQAAENWPKVASLHCR